jgi:hypothetical protein
MASIVAGGYTLLAAAARGGRESQLPRNPATGTQLFTWRLLAAAKDRNCFPRCHPHDKERLAAALRVG